MPLRTPQITGLGCFVLPLILRGHLVPTVVRRRMGTHAANRPRLCPAVAQSHRGSFVASPPAQGPDSRCLSDSNSDLITWVRTEVVTEQLRSATHMASTEFMVAMACGWQVPGPRANGIAVLSSTDYRPGKARQLPCERTDLKRSLDIAVGRPTVPKTSLSSTLGPGALYDSRDFGDATTLRIWRWGDYLD